MTTDPTSLPAPQCISRAADVGPTVRARRRAQSLRIDDAAALSGVSVDMLSRLENGKGAVRLDKLLAVPTSLNGSARPRHFRCRQRCRSSLRPPAMRPVP